MDLDTYALSYDAGQGEGSGNDHRTARPIDSKGKGRAVDDTDTTTSSAQGADDDGPTFASDMQQLTTSLGSWWSGFSKQSAQTLAQAQSKLQEASKNVNEQGGIVEYARKEARRIEKELEEKRREAKERVQRQEEEDKAARQREMDEAQDQVHETTANAPRKSSMDDIGSVQGEEIFDAEKMSGDAGSSTTTTKSATTATTTSSLFDRLQSLSTDPRVASLQKDVTSRINSLNLFGASGSGTSKEDATSQPDTLPTIFSDLSKSLSKLSSPETKELAKKYMKASEEVVGKVGEEWKDFLGELVRVVPPEHADQHGQEKSAVGGVDKGKDAAVVAAASPLKDAIEPQNGDAASESTAQPQPPSAKTPQDIPSQSQQSSTQAPHDVETTSKPEHRQEEEGEDSDSDWE